MRRTQLWSAVLGGKDLYAPLTDPETRVQYLVVSCQACPFFIEVLQSFGQSASLCSHVSVTARIQASLNSCLKRTWAWSLSVLLWGDWASIRMIEGKEMRDRGLTFHPFPYFSLSNETRRKMFFWPWLWSNVSVFGEVRSMGGLRFRVIIPLEKKLCCTGSRLVEFWLSGMPSTIKTRKSTSYLQRDSFNLNIGSWGLRGSMLCHHLNHHSFLGFILLATE